MAKITIVDGNDEIELSTAPKENIKAFMVKGERGTDGISPTVNATKVGKVTTLEITDKNGTRTTSINDGFDPTVTATKVQDTTTVSITDINGTRTTEIYDGRDLTGGVPADGVIGWDSDDLVYICDGTETGDYYLTYNSTGYYFTMPTVEDGDGLLFNTTSLELSLNGTTITTSSTGTGTELTFTDYVPNGYELTNPIPTVVDTYSTSTTDGYSANYLNDKLIKDETTIKNLIIEESIKSKNLLNVDSSFTVTSTQRQRDVAGVYLKAGVTYTLSCSDITSTNPYSYLFYFNVGQSSQFAIYLPNEDRSITFTPTVDVNTVRIYSSNAWNASANHTTTYTNLMIEEGDTVTDYTPYKAFDSTAYVLWNNPNPAVEFAGQSITLNDNISKYKYYEVIYRFSTSSGVYYSTGRLPVGNLSALVLPQHVVYMRGINDLSGTNMTFGNAFYYSTYGSTNITVANTVMMPYQILGYK